MSTDRMRRHAPMAWDRQHLPHMFHFRGEESSFGSSNMSLFTHVAHPSDNPVAPLIRGGGGILTGAQVMPFGSPLR